MFTCKEHFEALLEVKQSKFMAHLLPIGEFDAYLERLKAEHPKARHFVTAFRRMNEHAQIVEGSSDDGEPKGTSGKPSLHVLQGHDLVDVGVVVVRYFGGIKLGTGGLVRAYGDAVNRVVAASTLVEYVALERFTCKCGYSDLAKVEYLLAKTGVTQVQKEFGSSDVTLAIDASAEQIAQLKAELNRVIAY